MRIAYFVLWAATAVAQTADPTGSVSGIVTDAVTHMPVKKTMVTVNPAANFNGRNAAAQSTMSDASGAFALTNLSAGRYRVSFQQQNYPQARFGGVSKMVEIKAGESAGPVTVELIPGAAVSGRVVDEDGDPLSNCYVQIRQAKNPEQGVQMMGGSGSSQDGEYRLFGIAPGKYILSAQCGQAVFQARPLSEGPDPSPSRAYPAQYYPLATDAKSAQLVELTPGNEKSGIDFQMSPAPVTQVRGTFSAGADWRSGLVLQLIPIDRRGVNIGAGPNQDKGTFEFRQVFPGSYTLIAFAQGSEENRVGAWQRVDVGDKPVELALELKHAIDLTGKVEIESSGNTTNKPTPGQIGVQLIPQLQAGWPGSQTQVNDDGTFTLKGVMPGTSSLQVNAPFAFLKAAWLGSADVTNTPIDFSAGAAGTLKIVVSTNTATIHGSAPAGMVVQARRADEDRLFPGIRGTQGTQVDQNGQYNFGGLAPGKYRLMVVDQGGLMPDEGGQEVTVREGETVIADLKAPSAP